MMIEVKTMSYCDKDIIYSFLGKAGYGKFNLWPDVTGKNITRILLEDMNRIQDKGKIFVLSESNEIIALLAVKPLDWDSQHYGFKCAKIEYLLRNKTLRDDFMKNSLGIILDRFRGYCVESNIKFVYTSVDSRDFASNLALQKSGFRYILTWIDGIFRSSDKIPEMIEEKAEVGMIKPDEIEYFKKIAPLYYFKGGRFYLDPNFNKEFVDKMYSNLISFSFENNYIMLAYRIKNQPVGLFICEKIVTYESFSNLLVAPLRFLVVDPKFRNKKAAYNLFLKTLEYLKDKSNIITTGLDIHNLPSLNLHSKIGFKFNYTHNAYHWWNSF